MPFRENHVVFEDEPYIVDETRLALNVYVPKSKNSAKKPVMVWIHGGHFQFGCGEQEDPTVLGSSLKSPSYKLLSCVWRRDCRYNLLSNECFWIFVWELGVV